MKIQHKLISTFSAIIFASCLSFNSSALTPEERGNDVNMAVSASTLSMAVRSLGHDFKQYKDDHGNPHFVVTDKIGKAKDIAIYTGDCGSAGCEDVILYANLGKHKLSHKTMNEWNHISSMLRSRVAQSSDGTVGLSMAVSFLGHQDVEKMGLLIGMFFAEINMLSETIRVNK